MMFFLHRRVLQQLARVGIHSSDFSGDLNSTAYESKLDPLHQLYVELAYEAANLTIRLASLAFPTIFSLPITQNRWIIDTSLGQ